MIGEKRRVHQHRNCDDTFSNLRRNPLVCPYDKKNKKAPKRVLFVFASKLIFAKQRADVSQEGKRGTACGCNPLVVFASKLIFAEAVTTKRFLFTQKRRQEYGGEICCCQRWKHSFHLYAYIFTVSSFFICSAMFRAWSPIRSKSVSSSLKRMQASAVQVPDFMRSKWF